MSKEATEDPDAAGDSGKAKAAGKVKEPKAPKVKAEAKAAGKGKAAGKAKAGGKGKAARDGKGAAADQQGAISVARHPRVARAVRCARGWGGIAGLALGLVLALRAGVPPLQAMIRALAGGIAAYIVMWALAVAVARQLVVAEVRARGAEMLRAISASESAGERG